VLPATVPTIPQSLAPEASRTLVRIRERAKPSDPRTLLFREAVTLSEKGSGAAEELCLSSSDSPNSLGTPKPTEQAGDKGEDHRQRQRPARVIMPRRAIREEVHELRSEGSVHLGIACRSCNAAYDHVPTALQAAWRENR
jgi:hypothetical protein